MTAEERKITMMEKKYLISIYRLRGKTRKVEEVNQWLEQLAGLMATEGDFHRIAGLTKSYCRALNDTYKGRELHAGSHEPRDGYEPMIYVGLDNSDAQGSINFKPIKGSYDGLLPGQEWHEPERIQPFESMWGILPHTFVQPLNIYNQETNLWLARDKSGRLCLYDVEPERIKEGYFVANSAGFEYLIPEEFYPGLTWENSPRKITIK